MSSKEKVIKNVYRDAMITSQDTKLVSYKKSNM